MDKEIRKAIKKLRPLIFKVVVDNLDTPNPRTKLKNFSIEDEVYLYTENNPDLVIEHLVKTNNIDVGINLMTYLIGFYTEYEEYEKCQTLFDVRDILQESIL